MGNDRAPRRRATGNSALAAARRAAVGTLAAGFAHAVPSVSVLAAIAGRARVPRLGPIRLRGGGGDGRVALTFDDGPSPTTTPRVLALLDKLGLRATFFVTGSEVDAYPGLVEDIRAASHDVETHGMEHAHHLLRGPGWVLADTARAVEGLRAVGVTPRYLRPPYGQASAGTLRAGAGAVERLGPRVLRPQRGRGRRPGQPRAGPWCRRPLPRQRPAVRRGQRGRGRGCPPARRRGARAARAPVGHGGRGARVSSDGLILSGSIGHLSTCASRRVGRRDPTRAPG